jgi:outer membrane protein TolC
MRKILILLVPISLWAQDPLSLKDAVRLALRDNKTVVAADAGISAARSRIDQARGAMLPKLNYSETWSRSDNPVFVFSSLLTQHQFGPQNFNIGPLNRPDALNNFQSTLTVDQVLYDAGQTKNAVKSSRLATELSEEERRKAQMEVIAGVTRAYYGAVLSAESLKAADQAVKSAEADLRRAQSIRAAGMSTDADVLSIRVHLAAVNEQRINRTAELEVAKAALNDALGQRLDTQHTLTTPLAALDLPDMALEQLEGEGAAKRPEARQSLLATDLARTQLEAAKTSLLPALGQMVTVGVALATETLAVPGTVV